MNETLLVALISIGFGAVVLFGSFYFEKKTKANINPWLWAGVACAIVWAMWWFTGDFLDIGSK